MYSKRFTECVTFLIDLEGGYNPEDPSMYGISQSWFDANVPTTLLGAAPLALANIKWLKKEAAVLLYHWGFWQKYHLSLFPKPLDLIMLCQLVHRETKAVEILQKCLLTKMDAIIGPMTILKLIEFTRTSNGFLRQNCVVEICQFILETFSEYYTETYPESKNLKGYLNRLSKINDWLREEVK